MCSSWLYLQYWKGTAKHLNTVEGAVGLRKRLVNLPLVQGVTSQIRETALRVCVGSQQWGRGAQLTSSVFLHQVHKY